MFNPERLLGGLLTGRMSHKYVARTVMSSAGMGSSTAIGMGVLGTAFAAAEHFMNKASGTAQGAPAGPPPAGPPGAPGASAPPPPPPAPGSAAPSGPPPAAPTAGAPASTSGTGGVAILLIRTMIASAAADGNIDDDERSRIIKRMESVGMSDEERTFINGELNAPWGAADIAAQATDPDTARQVYAVSLLAVEVDTDEERAYLRELAARMGLAAATVADVHAMLGVPAF